MDLNIPNHSNESEKKSQTIFETYCFGHVRLENLPLGWFASSVRVVEIPPSKAMGPSRSGAGVGVGMVWGVFLGDLNDSEIEPNRL